MRDGNHTGWQGFFVANIRYEWVLHCSKQKHRLVTVEYENRWRGDKVRRRPFSQRLAISTRSLKKPKRRTLTPERGQWWDREHLRNGKPTRRGNLDQCTNFLLQSLIPLWTDLSIGERVVSLHTFFTRNKNRRWCLICLEQEWKCN